MPKTNFKELLEAGAHFGHLKRKWNPAMAPYIFMERNDIHIIDLNKTVVKIEESANALKQIAKSGKKILFVATKKQAKEIVAEKLQGTNMPYVTERWLGGMLTNFPTIRKAVKKMNNIDKMKTNGTLEILSKREQLQIMRQRAKLEKNLGSIADLTRLPAAMFIVDVNKENIAVREAKRLNIPVFAMVDTNSDPSSVDFVIPANDDASASIELITDIMISSIKEGLAERKIEREKNAENKKAKKEEKAVVKEETKAVEKTPVVEAKKEEIKEEPAKKKPAAKKAATEEVETKEEKTPAKKTTAKKAPAKKAAAKKTTAKKAPAKKAAARKEDKE
jgi:small subunit ribosomal protein S2